MRFTEVLRSIDWVLFAATLLLVCVGLSMLLSATYTEGVISPLFVRQGLAAIVGLGVFFVAVKTPYHTWRRYSTLLYGLGIGGLILVTLTGAIVRGTVSRLEFFGFQLQPSEFMKVALIVALAWLLSKYQFIRWRQLLLSAVLVLIPTILVLREPDFGMASLMIFTWIGVLLFWGLPWKYIAILGLVGVLVAGGAWQWFLFDYQKDRIRTFMNPSADPLESGYNVTQSIIALGSGQVVGRGLGHGPQSQLKFLPERHTDFILASIGEELGFIGVTLVISLYGIVLWRILRIVYITEDPFGKLIAVGAFFLVLASFTVNTGMNMGLLPVTGIPLPFVSYGGSSLAATFLLLGFVQSVRVYSRFVQAPPTEISGFI